MSGGGRKAPSSGFSLLLSPHTPPNFSPRRPRMAAIVNGLSRALVPVVIGVGLVQASLYDGQHPPALCSALPEGLAHLS